MFKRPFLLVFLLIISTILALNEAYAEFHLWQSDQFLKDNTAESVKKKVVLIPLDSRPPCRDFVIDAARIASIDVITPEDKLLDYFTIPGEPSKIRQWLLDNANGTDAIIISIDQLLYGGLVAARESNLTEEDIKSLTNFLIELHEIVPNTPIYAFSILPRMQPQQSIDNYQQRRAIMAYSRLRGRAQANLAVDDEAILEAFNEIKPENFESYIHHFEECENLNQRLIELTQDGILDRLVIGLDDGEQYSIQNELVDNLWQMINNSNVFEKISLLHGADEIALSLLSEVVNNSFDSKLKVCVQYNNSLTPSKVLPYMAVPIKDVINEKLSQLKLEIVDKPEYADFTLLISVNDKDNSAEKIYNANRISNLIENGQKVALVDLSWHFDKNETLLPILIDRGVAVNSLIAYAGWNTASNSIGTAISQAVIYTKNHNFIDNAIENLRFLNQRFIEDQFYLKDVIDTVNHALKKNGSYDTSYLDYGTEYEFATFVMETAMNKKIADHKQSRAFKAPIRIKLPDGLHKIRLKDFKADMNYPWPRTFEIKLKINALDYIEVK